MTADLTTPPRIRPQNRWLVQGLSLNWDDGWPRFYNPATGSYLETNQEVKRARAEAEVRAAQAEAELHVYANNFAASPGDMSRLI